MEKKTYELTNAQKSIWLTEEYQKGTSIGNISGLVEIHEKIDEKKLEQSIKEFIKRNDSMRTKIIVEEGSIKQIFEDYKDLDIEIHQIKTKEELGQKAEEIAKTPFKLQKSLLFNISIYKYPDGKGGILISFHHIIGDAWTAGLIVNDIMDIYEELVNTGKLNESQKFTYIDYIESEKEYLASQKYKKDATFWNEKFQEIPQVPEIPSKKRIEKTLELEYACKRKEYILSKKQINQIKEYCKKEKISIYNFFMGIYAIYTSRICNIEDFVIGTPILNRTNYKEKQTTGMFISTIPLKIHIEERAKFSKIVQTIAKDMMQIYRHQKYPYQDILQNLRKKEAQVPNLYDFLISYQNSKTDVQTNTIPYESKWVTNGNVSDSLNIHLYDTNDFGTLHIAYDYQKNKYDEKDIDEMHKRILEITEQIIENHEINIQEISILTKKEKQELKKSEVKTKENFKYCENILEQIEKNAKNNLSEIAIETETESITYKELLEKVNKLANYLEEKGMKKNTNIGIFTNRSIDVIIRNTCNNKNWSNICTNRP